MGQYIVRVSVGEDVNIVHPPRAIYLKIGRLWLRSHRECPQQQQPIEGRSADYPIGELATSARFPIPAEIPVHSGCDRPELKPWHERSPD
ncbi:hypothetical protein H4N54_04505 [Limnospira fusiformis KN01]|uniref:hypothetical protein n=1 Tax=Limnospira TaxID=2596745 RepID=UPI001F31869D|nr:MULTISPECIES: hypothetical protein [Limnospira]MDT9200663.1 hypothetical protein [Limnospira sp. PMC 1042.18]ULB46632.1 hypothetical protein H4N54_04505 [Limnospira fusiformis KN01]